MGRVSGCCGTDWCRISGDQPVILLIVWLLLPLDLRSCFQSRVFLQLLFRGSGIFTDDRAMVLAATIRVRPLGDSLFVAFRDILGSSERHRSVLCRMLWTDCLCFECGASSLFQGFMFPQFVLVLATEGDLLPCCGGCLTTGALRWSAVPIFGDFSSLFDAMLSDTDPFFRHGTICWILSLPRSLWSRWFPSAYALFYYLTCDYLVITGSMISRRRILTFTPL